MEVCPQEHLVEEAKEPSKAKGRGKKAQAAAESLITKWIKEPNAPLSTNVKPEYSYALKESAFAVPSVKK